MRILNKEINEIFSSLSQQPSIVLEFKEVIVDDLLPGLSSLTASPCMETRQISLNLLTEFLQVFFHVDNSAQATGELTLSSDILNRLSALLDEIVIPQGECFLIDQEPAPSNFLKLMTVYVEHCHVPCGATGTGGGGGILVFQRFGLHAMLIQLILEQQQVNPGSVSLLHALTLLGSMAARKETDMKALFYECDLVPVLSTTITQIAVEFLQVSVPKLVLGKLALAFLFHCKTLRNETLLLNNISIKNLYLNSEEKRN